MGGPDATPNLWKQLFSAVRASGGYPGNVINFVRKIEREIIWNFYKSVTPGLCSWPDNTFYIIRSVILLRLSECCSMHNKGQSIHFTNNPSCMVEITGVWNDAFHEPIPVHQLIFVTKCGFRPVHISLSTSWYSLGSMMERFHMTIKGGSFWELKLCEMQVLAI